MEKKKWNISYLVYIRERLKNKVSFFGIDTYPLYSRVTHGISSLNFKSRLFDQLLKKKYQLSAGKAYIAPDILYVKKLEEELIKYVIRINRNNFSLKAFKEDYVYFSRDLLDSIDEAFKQYLIGFLNDRGITSIASIIKIQADNFTGDVLLQDLKKMLPVPMYKEMMAESIAAAPPYIPIVSFIKMKYKNRIPVFLVFHFFHVEFQSEINAFVNSYFPEYNRNHPNKYLLECVDKVSSLI